MFSQCARLSVLANVVLASAALTARAGDCCTPCCPPPTRTVCVTEWVKENYLTTRTVYRTECVHEKYTAFRTECVPEVRTRVCTVNRQVPEYHDVVRTVCVSVPAVETRTVMKTVVTCKPVTTVTRKCVDMGHWECREVPCHKCCLSRKCKKNCCCDCCTCCCVPTKTVKVWCPNKVWVETPCTRMVKVCECVPTTVQVTVCKMVSKQETVRVCSYRCVCEQKTETFTVLVAKQVPFEATRMVTRCVPVQEQVTCCRLVPHTVVKEVACCCQPCCCCQCKCKKVRCCR